MKNRGASAYDRKDWVIKFHAKGGIGTTCVMRIQLGEFIEGI